MQRTTIFHLLHATNEILSKPEIKTSLSAKQIYTVSKLDRKVDAENKNTGKHQQALLDIRALALAKEGITEDEKKDIANNHKENWQKVWDEEVENPVEVKIPFAASEKILQHLTKADVTTAAIDFLIEAPEVELTVV